MSELQSATKRLRASARALPERPGVYMMLDFAGELAYVGKAINLRRRVTSYATPSARRDPKVKKLVARFGSLAFLETPSELEALLLESRLIKERHPALNRRLLEPESCRFFRVDFRETLPKLSVVRTYGDDGAKYLGPFWRASLAEEAAEGAADALRLTRCTKPQQTCIYHEIGKCAGPCRNKVSQAEYRELVRAAWESLAGHTDHITGLLVARRGKLAENLSFEEAERVHRQIRAVEYVRRFSPRSVNPHGKFAVVVPSYIPNHPVVLVFSHGRLVAKIICGPKYPDPGILGEILASCPEKTDLLPGRYSPDDMIILISYLHRHGLDDFLVPLSAEEITQRIDLLRENGNNTPRRPPCVLGSPLKSSESLV